MQIGVVAKKVGLSVDAIRFYERNALLPRASRTEGGFRRYGDSDVDTLSFIRRVQGLGFTLGKVRELLGLRHSRMQACAPVRRRLEQKLTSVRLETGDRRDVFFRETGDRRDVFFRGEQPPPGSRSIASPRTLSRG